MRHSRDQTRRPAGRHAALDRSTFGTMRSSSTLAASLGLLLLTAACQADPWTDSQRAEAVRMCRGQFGFPPISVFESADAAYIRFMCQCEVDWIADRVPHRQFENRLQLNEVNRVLQTGGVYCLQQMKNGAK